MPPTPEPTGTPAGAAATRTAPPPAAAPDARPSPHLRTLLAAQAVGALGLSAGGTAGPLIAGDILGSAALTTVPLGLLVLGTAGSAPLTTALMRRHGRAAGLTAAYAVATAGAVLVVAAAATSGTALLLAGSLLLGAGNTAVMLGRYVAADAAPAAGAGRAVSTAMTAVTAGAVLGPTLMGPAATPAHALGLPGATGLFLLAAVTFPAAAAVTLRLQRRLPRTAAGTPPPRSAPAATTRPRTGPRRTRLPLLGRVRKVPPPASGREVPPAPRRLARTLAAPGEGPSTSSTRACARHAESTLPQALDCARAGGTPMTPQGPPSGRTTGLYGHGLALAVMGCANLTMVTAMAAAPVHLHAHHWTLDTLGLLVAGHVLLMFGPSALTGRLTDRIGSALTALSGTAVLLVALPLVALAAASPAWLTVLGILLLGLGWNLVLISGSALVVQRTPAEHRHRAEGLGESAMGLGAVLGTVALAGPLIEAGGLPLLCLALGAVTLLPALPLAKGRRG
ncbi:MFS transporter [Streptomyces sp. LHD-70]|uniref:MFS transporter n=1 Tax=Streptomyces sp. LHD-70 TaxID=3072140 RepID=UPI00280DBBED|nr:MFS transporter [Streptomyces sp. LHD-70]MDQ8706937.1 MFS transporter [Streptomyces sp. LHD-70]